jgi:hypothetical protein
LLKLKAKVLLTQDGVETGGGKISHLLYQGAAMADVWSRVLVSLDEEIISLDIPRTHVRPPTSLTL